MIQMDLSHIRQFIPLPYEEARAAQLRLAARFDLPVAIHTRAAWDDMCRIIEAETERARADGRRLRGVFHAFMCFQVPVVFVFSAFIDFTMTPAAAVMPTGYIPRFIVSFLGNAVLALGIVMQIHSRTIVQPGEGIVLAESVFFRHPFGTMKVVNDWSLVIIACIVALLFTGGIIGVREGTFVSALCVGLFAKQFLKLWPMPKAPEPCVAEEKAMA